MRIKDIPKNFRPREKALSFGIETLSDVELLALIIGSGVKNHSALDIASSLLKTYITLNNLVLEKSETLREECGLSKINALKLEATFELHKRLIKPIYNLKEKYDKTEIIYQRYKYLENEEEEHFILLLLDYRFHIIKEKSLSIGNDSSVNVSIRKLIFEIFSSQARRIVIIHNHPNSECYPTKDDIESTEKIIALCDLIDVVLFDHIIINKDGYYSFKLSKIIQDLKH